MSAYDQAIKLTVDNHHQIVKDTPFNSETVQALTGTNVHCVIVKTVGGQFLVVPQRMVVTFGFGEAANPATGWYKIVLK